MSLVDLIGSGKDIPLGGGSFKVHGLTLEAVGDLLRTHYAELAGIFEGKVSLEDVIAKLPDLAHKILAKGIGESEDVVKRLPMGAQLKALEAIWDLTAITADELGKMVRSLVDGLQIAERRLGLNSGNGN